MERVDCNVSALEGVNANSPILAMLPMAFMGQPSQRNLHLITLLQAAMAEDPNRVLAFFLRDNPNLIDHVREVMGFDVLSEWLEGVIEDALEQDSIAKMFVAHLAGGGEPDDVMSDFNKAADEKRFNRVIFLLSIAGNTIANSLGADWSKLYEKFAADGNGLPYFTAQLLNGSMHAFNRKTWKSTIGGLATRYMEARGIPHDGTSHGDTVSYLTDQAEAFSPERNPSIAIAALIAHAWDGY